MGYRGTLPAPLWETLQRAWESPFAIASNYAREAKHYVALGASLGYLSNITPDGLGYDNYWHITAEGEYALRHHLKG